MPSTWPATTRDRGDHPDRGRDRGLLHRRRPAGAGRGRLPGRGRRGPAQRARPARPDPAHAQTGGGHGGRLRHRRRPRAARGLRPHHRRRQRPLRSGRAAGGELRRRPAGPDRGPEAGPGDLVPLRAVRRPGGAADGAGQPGGPARASGGGNGRRLPAHAPAQPDRAAHDQGGDERGRRRPGRVDAAGRGRDHALLHDRGGPGGPGRLRPEAEARLLPLPPASLRRPRTVASDPAAPDGTAAGAGPGRLRVWWLATRPATLAASVSPVLAGTAVAVHDGRVRSWAALTALLVALAMQVGVNYANDYSDHVRGADRRRRGPLRAASSGLVPPGQVKAAALAAFGLAAAAGLALALATDWRLLPVGALAVVAAWTYTGGPWPYGYRGLGEVFVFAFFGLFATAGTVYVEALRVPPAAWAAWA